MEYLAFVNFATTVFLVYKVSQLVHRPTPTFTCSHEPCSHSCICQPNTPEPCRFVTTVVDLGPVESQLNALKAQLNAVWEVAKINQHKLNQPPTVVERERVVEKVVEVPAPAAARARVEANSQGREKLRARLREIAERK